MPRTYRLLLNPKSAATCQSAHRKVCTCRCEGTLHGKDHAPYMRLEFELLKAKKAAGGVTLITEDDVQVLLERSDSRNGA